jgi:aerobic carbon-monoxide dehydrogenase medium subunit
LKPAPFEYASPTSVEEALEALARGGIDAKVIAGGQSLMPALAFRIVRPSLLVDLNPVAELAYVKLDGDVLVVGAMTRHRDIERFDGLDHRCRLIAEAVEEIGHIAIRNRGTVGGSLAHADPAAEWAALALALDAELDVDGPAGRRTIAAGDFFQTYFMTALEPGEVLTGIRFRLPPSGAGSAFVELARRHGDYAITGVAAWILLGQDERVTDCRVALIGVGDRAVRARSAEIALMGSPPSAETLAAAAEAVEEDIEPNGDLHATERYRRRAARILTRRAMERSIARCREGSRG